METPKEDKSTSLVEIKVEPGQKTAVKRETRQSAVKSKAHPRKMIKREKVMTATPSTSSYGVAEVCKEEPDDVEMVADEYEYGAVTVEDEDEPLTRFPAYLQVPETPPESSEEAAETPPPPLYEDPDGGAYVDIYADLA